MKRTTTLKKETRRSIFAWVTLITIFVTSIIFLNTFCDVFFSGFGLLLLMDDPKIGPDFKEFFNESLLIFIKSLPIYIPMVFFLFIWKDNSIEYFFKSLFPRIK